MMTWGGPVRGEYVCTGFAVDRGRILTAAHCLGDNMQANGNPVVVLKADAYYDLAALAMPTTMPALALREKDIERGEAVTAVGFGFGFTVPTPIEAIVMLVNYQVPAQDVERTYPPMHFYQPAFIGGMSGGPVVDESGRVIGMVQMSGEGVGLGVSTLIMRAFLLGL
jgi:S1-C subfamily serine protease